MNQPLQRAILVGAIVAFVCWLLHTWSLGFALWLGLAGFVVVITLLTPTLGMRWLGELTHALRALHWRREQGAFHRFNGVPLHVHDDGRSVWIDGQGVQRVMGTQDPEDVLAARHAGHWRRDDKGRLMLRVDTLVQSLATLPNRTEPSVQRFRRYLERDLMFPAAERRRRAPSPP